MYRPVFQAGPCVVVGDFNSSALWDRKHRADCNHSALVRSLGEYGLVSAYHSFFDEFMGRKRVRRFTI
jgi:hypothetical protein